MKLNKNQKKIKKSGSIRQKLAAGLLSSEEKESPAVLGLKEDLSDLIAELRDHLDDRDIVDLLRSHIITLTNEEL